MPFVVVDRVLPNDRGRLVPDRERGADAVAFDRGYHAIFGFVVLVGPKHGGPEHGLLRGGFEANAIADVGLPEAVCDPRELPFVAARFEDTFVAVFEGLLHEDPAVLRRGNERRFPFAIDDDRAPTG